jgi:RHS repeat-associated protein
MHFQPAYNQREAFQPATFSYSNLGSKWTFNWLSYITDDPNNLGSPVTGYMQGGGTESYSGFDSFYQAYALQPDSHVILHLDSPNSIYTRSYPNGYTQIYSKTDGSTGYPRNVFLTKVVDPAGNTVTFTYDSHNRLASVRDALGQTNTLYYGSTNLADPAFYQITRVTDPFGRHADFTYNASNQLTNITDVVGISSKFSYGLSDSGAMDFITSMTTPYGTTTFTEGVNGRDRWLQATDPVGQNERMEYHDTLSSSSISDYGQPAPTTIPAGDPAPTYLIYRNSFFWDKKAMQLYPGDYTKARLFHWLHTSDINICSGTEESVKSPLEGRTWFTYPGQATNNTYQQSTNNSPSTVARVLDDGTSQIYQYQYNGFGNIIKTIDPLGRSTTNIYAANLIDLLSVKQQTGPTNFDLLASFTYNTNHLPLTMVDAAGKTNFLGYSTNGQLIAMTNALNETVLLNYNTNGYLTNVVAGVLAADKHGNLTNGPLSTNSFTYDTSGRVRTVTDPLGYTITTSYDAADRPTNITFMDGTYQQIVYNNLDPVLVKDRDGHWTSLAYDAFRHLTDVYDNLSRHTHFDWCGCGSLLGITDPLGHVTSWIRDLQNRATTKVYADGTSVAYAYETNSSRLKMVTDAKNQSALYTYFVDDNRKRVTYSNAVVATPSVAFTYDTNYNLLLTMTDGIGTNNYSYYAITNGQLGAGQLQSVTGPWANDTLTYSYDQLGRITNRAINGVSQMVAFDALHRVTLVTNVLGRFTNTYVGGTTLISTNFYPNGQKTMFSYLSVTNDERLQEIWNKNSTNGTLSKFDYTYTPAGQITNWTQQADTNVATAYSYGCDAGNQLLNAVLKSTGPGAAVLKQYGYGYDLAGNRTSEQIDTGTSQSRYDGVNQLTNRVSGSGPMQFAGGLDKQGTVTVGGNAATMNHQTTNFVGYGNVSSGTNVVPVVATDYNNDSKTNQYQVIVTNGAPALAPLYDANGNMTNDGLGLSYEYDAADRTTAINRGTTNRTEFLYDGFGRRVQVIEKTNGVAMSTNRYVWCGLKLCEQRDNTGAAVIRRFFGEGEQISGTNYFFTHDHLGSIREMTDGTGAIKARYDYDPYGRRTRLLGAMDADFGYTRHFMLASQPDHTLTFYRLYRPDLGRWLSRDPAREGGGRNLYLFARNDPVRFVDPLGLSWRDVVVGSWTTAGAILGAVVGFAAGGGGGAIAGLGVGDAVTIPAGAAYGAGAGATAGSALGHSAGTAIANMLGLGNTVAPTVVNTTGSGAGNSGPAQEGFTDQEEKDLDDCLDQALGKYTQAFIKSCGREPSPEDLNDFVDACMKGKGYGDNYMQSRQ